MRFLHTADWHLGRMLAGYSLLDDQAHVLDQFVALVRETRPDAVLLAGDVYDRAVPPADAVALLDDTVARLAACGVPLVAIAGNHDSPERLGFGSRLFAGGGVHIAGPLGATPLRVPLADAHGPLHIVALPYAEPAVVREVLGRDDLDSHDAAMGALCDVVRAATPAGTRVVLVAHAFVAGGEESASERALSVGGSGVVAPERFDGFAYVALGHLHRPQLAGGPRVRYSGSLLKYSASEALQRKSVSLVEVDAAGAAQVEEITLAPRRDLRVVTGELDTLLREPPSDDYIHVRLLDREPPHQPAERLRAVFPSLLGVEFAGVDAPGSLDVTAIERTRRRSDLEVFDDFVRAMTGEAMSDAEREAFAAAVGTRAEDDA